MNREQLLRKRIKWLTWLFIAGLVVSGATALPLRWEVERLMEWLGVAEWGAQSSLPPLVEWLFKIRNALEEVEDKYPFLFYGTDWLAFGHFIIGLAFVGALRDPLRNRWLFDFGLIACTLVIPFAFGFGGLRGIPVWWRLMDCSFGAIGFVPLWFCRRWSRELDANAGVISVKVP